MAKLVQGAGALKKRLREDAAAAESSSNEVPNLKSNDTETKRRKKNGADETAPAKEGKSIKATKRSKSKSPKKLASADEDVDNVVYLGHIPNGFFETEMRSFFSQFGNVRRVKLFRSKKTGNSKGYAFIQFETMDVAQVAAESMDGYLLNNKKLVAHVVEKSKCHSGMFLPYKSKPAGEPTVVLADKSEDDIKRVYSKVLRSEKKKLNKIRASGIEF